MLLLFRIMFLTVFLPVLYVLADKYINTAQAIAFSATNVPLTPGFVLNFGETPSIVNAVSLPASAVVAPPNVVTGFNPTVVNPDPPAASLAPYVVPSGFNTPYLNNIPDTLPSPEVVTLPFSSIPAFQQVSLAALPEDQLPGENIARINPSASAFIREASGIIVSNAALNGLYNLQELPPLQLSDAYFNSLENTFGVFHVPDSINISSAVSQTIGSAADAVSPPSFLNAALKTLATFLADQGILTTSNALPLAQSYSKTVQNALNAATVAGTTSPRVDAIVDGGTSFLATLGVSIPHHIDELARTFRDNIIASKQ